MLVHFIHQADNIVSFSNVYIKQQLERHIYFFFTLISICLSVPGLRRYQKLACFPWSCYVYWSLQHYLWVWFSSEEYGNLRHSVWRSLRSVNIYWLFSSLSRIFHLHNLGPCSSLTPFEQGRIFIVLYLL